MLGGRILTKVTRWGQSFLRPPSFQKAWGCPSSPCTRAISFTKLPFESAPPNPAPPSNTDINLIRKRFFRSESNGSSSSEGSSFSSKIFAAVGVLFGICGGGATAYMNKDTILGQYDFVVSCEPEKEKTRDKPCKEEPCVEKRPHDTVCLRDRVKECLEEKIIRANADLELALMDTKIKAIDYTEAAIKAYCDAIALMEDFINLGYNAIDDDSDKSEDCSTYADSWCCVYKASKLRCAMVKDALQKGQVAWELLCRLREVIESGKACQFTSCNPLLCVVQEALTCAEAELVAIRKEMEKVYSDHELVEMHKSGIESFRKELKTMVYASFDEKECGQIKFVEQEVAMMIDQGYIRLLQVQKEWARKHACATSKLGATPPPPPAPVEEEPCEVEDEDDSEGQDDEEEAEDAGEAPKPVVTEVAEAPKPVEEPTPAEVEKCPEPEPKSCKVEQFTLKLPEPIPEPVPEDGDEEDEDEEEEEVEAEQPVVEPPQQAPEEEEEEDEFECEEE